MIDTKYFKEYRERLGFNNQDSAKKFFGAKDILPAVDYGYIEVLNTRLSEIIGRINSIAHEELKISNTESFVNENIRRVFQELKKNNIIQKLNNQGRRPEEVYFSWMRGFVVSSYFLSSISKIFGVALLDVNLIGDDDFKNLETFKRTPKADLEIKLTNNEKIRVEVQSGFQGVNDIKQHKVLEARKIKRELGLSSLVMHFDLFNGQVAFVKIDKIKDDDISWITRQQMEGQTVFNIDQNYFAWKLTELPPKISEIL